MIRKSLTVLLLLLLVFIVPALAHLGWWAYADRPRSWSSANWGSARMLPPPKRESAEVLVMAARTGGLKGAFATHSWLLLKKPGSERYDRYDVVGWGNPVRRNAYPADARWFSNDPVVYYRAKGDKARALLPQIEAAIREYRWQQRGDYTMWPGPNSNTFVASIIRAVPGFDAVPPTTAIGRDFPEHGAWFTRTASGSLRLSAGGYAGLVIGRADGIEFNFLGLVAGINPWRGEVKIPAFGTLLLWPDSQT